jgi:glycosyltransferase involved in cell wall biosynthesis
MLLIEASNINLGGGLVLLRYIIKELKQRGEKFHIIVDNRIDLPEIEIEHKTYSNFKFRDWHIRQLLKTKPIKACFCFGNFPPSFKLPINVITFFQNTHLTGTSDYSSFSTTLLIGYKLRMLYLNKVLSNTDHVIFQSSFVREIFLKKYKYNLNQTSILPFFDEALFHSYNIELDNIKKEEDSFIYPSFPWPHKNHERLLEAWQLLANENIFPRLYLTIPDTRSALYLKITTLKQQGLDIVNLGNLTHNELFKFLKKSKYLIYPSLSETFGLSLVEGAMSECAIIAGDLPYVREVVEPSLFFDPYSIESISEAVKKACYKNVLPPTNILIQNKIDGIIDLLYKDKSGTGKENNVLEKI